MKNSSSCAFGIAALFLFSPIIRADTILEWKAADSKTDDTGAVTLHDPVSDYSVLFPTGAKIEPDTDVPGGKVLTLDGTQGAGGGASTEKLPVMDSVAITAKIKPFSISDRPLFQAPIVSGLGWDLRYNFSRKSFVFNIAFKGDAGHGSIEVEAKAMPDEWNDVVAEVAGNTLTINVNGTEVTKTEDEHPLGPFAAYPVIVGRPNLEIGGFTGSIAKIRISDKP